MKPRCESSTSCINLTANSGLDTRVKNMQDWLNSFKAWISYPPSPGFSFYVRELGSRLIFFSNGSGEIKWDALEKLCLWELTRQSWTQPNVRFQYFFHYECKDCCYHFFFPLSIWKYIIYPIQSSRLLSSDCFMARFAWALYIKIMYHMSEHNKISEC